MSGKPSPLFLGAIAVIGTALASSFSAGGIPLLVLAIPFAVLATILHDAEKGILVGAGASLASGLLIQNMDIWSTVGYALASMITVWAYDASFPKNKNELNALVFTVGGTLLAELLNEITLRESVFFRSDFFLGSTPYLGVQLVVNALILWAGLSTWNVFSTAKK